MVHALSISVLRKEVMSPTVFKAAARCVLRLVVTTIIMYAWERLKTRKVGRKSAQVRSSPNVPEQKTEIRVMSTLQLVGAARNGA